MLRYLSEFYIILLLVEITSGFQSGEYRFPVNNILHEIVLSKEFRVRPSLRMASSDMVAQDLTKTIISAPSMNTRKITASIMVDSPIDDVWSIITDYDNLAVHVPNLVKSYVLPQGGSSSSLPLRTIRSITSNNQMKNDKGEIRIFQEGAQKIVGFDFRASLTLDMKEETGSEGRALNEKKLNFKLADSPMFSSFDGTWSVRNLPSKELDPISNDYIYKYKTLLTYSVLVKPRGPVPVLALEWRIKEDVPTNLIAMKIAAEKVTMKSRLSLNDEPKTFSWGSDETLQIYISKKSERMSDWASNALASTEVSEKLSSVLNAITADRFNVMLSKKKNALKYY